MSQKKIESKLARADEPKNQHRIFVAKTHMHSHTHLLLPLFVVLFFGHIYV